jgi:hypothetical protein
MKPCTAVGLAASADAIACLSALGQADCVPKPVLSALRVGTPIRRRRHGSTASRGRAQRPNTKTFVNAKMNEQIVLE